MGVGRRVDEATPFVPQGVPPGQEQRNCQKTSRKGAKGQRNSHFSFPRSAWERTEGTLRVPEAESPRQSRDTPVGGRRASVPCVTTQRYRHMSDRRSNICLYLPSQHRSDRNILYPRKRSDICRDESVVTRFQRRQSAGAYRGSLHRNALDSTPREDAAATPRNGRLPPERVGCARQPSSESSSQADEVREGEKVSGTVICPIIPPRDDS